MESNEELLRDSIMNYDLDSFLGVIDKIKDINYIFKNDDNYTFLLHACISLVRKDHGRWSDIYIYIISTEKINVLYSMIEKLLELGINVNAKNSSGMSALEMALIREDIDCIKLLLHYGSDTGCGKKELYLLRRKLEIARL